MPPAALAGRDDARDHVGGMAKPMPTEPPESREDRGVDADQPAVQVDQRAARIARD